MQSNQGIAMRLATYHSLFGDWLRLRTARAESDALAIGMVAQGLARRDEAGTAPAQAPRPRILVTAALDEESLAALGPIGIDFSVLVFGLLLTVATVALFGGFSRRARTARSGAAMEYGRLDCTTT